MKTIFYYVAVFAIIIGVGSHYLNPNDPGWFATQADAAQAQTQAATPVPAYCVGRDAHCDALRNAGFNEEQTHIMIAIGMAESHLRPDAVGDISLANAKWGYSYGSWQIRSLNNPKGEWWRDKNFITASLQNQAKAAYAISGNGTNFKPWSTYNNKDWKGRPQTPPYLQYL